MAALATWLFKSRLGNVVGLLIAAALAYGAVYAKGYFAATEDQHVKQLKDNELATKQRREVDRAVPRTDWDDRVDELR